MENLSDFYLQIARTELNETESRKQQSIKQFYKWLSKHPFITKCEIDPSQIVEFLRARKYHMSKVYDSFNILVIISKDVSHVLIQPNESIDKLLSLYDKGSFLVTKNFDKNGRRILIIKYKVLEDLNLNFSDIVKLNQLITSMLITEPEVQICGIVVINDFRGISMNFLKVVDVNALSKIMPASECGALRIKKIVFLGLPAIASSLFEVIKAFMSDKMRSRIELCKNHEALSKVMDVSDLTVEYGGTGSAEDCIKHHKKAFETASAKCIRFMESLEVDEEKMRNFERKQSFEDVGSFRKLEID